MGRINIRDRILYVYMYTGYIMVRLYWRIKRNGRWTWTPAVYDLHRDGVKSRVEHPDGELVTLWWPSKSELSGDEKE